MLGLGWGTEEAVKAANCAEAAAEKSRRWGGEERVRLDFRKDLIFSAGGPQKRKRLKDLPQLMTLKDPQV